MVGSWLLQITTMEVAFKSAGGNGSTPPPLADSQTGLLCYRGNLGAGPKNGAGAWTQDTNAVDGQGAFGWENRQGFRNFIDGTSNSILLVENALGVEMGSWAAISHFGKTGCHLSYSTKLGFTFEVR